MQCMYKIGTTGIDVATISFEVEKDDVESVLSLLKKRKNNGDSKIKNLSETNAVISLASHRFVCGYETKDTRLTQLLKSIVPYRMETIWQI